MTRLIQNIGKLDANETAFLLRELMATDPVNYETLFPELKGRNLVPLIDGIGEYEDSYRYKMWTMSGKAVKISGKTTVLPTVNATVAEKIRNIKTLGNKIEYTVDEIRKAAAHNIPLDSFYRTAAMAALEYETDTMIAVGDEASDIDGLLNHTGVNATTAGAKTGGGTAWSGTATVAEIIKDVNLMIRETRTAIKSASSSGGKDTPQFNRFTLLLPTGAYTYMAQLQKSDASDKTVLQWVIENNPFIDAIEEWWQCDTAGASNTRAFLYPRNPMCVGAILNQDFTPLPPQAIDLKIQVPCQQKCGGTVIRYPFACRYMDTI